MGKTMKQYAIVIYWYGNNYSAHSPDVPGCVATGATIDETKENIREALEFHIEGLRLAGLPVPEPSAQVATVPIAA
jgi:predicted RNase H-like HicB family nuclease